MTGGQAARPASTNGPQGPPPPWHRARLQPERCAACAGPCAEVCEAGIVRFHPAGHPLAGTPYLAFEDTGCTFCGQCRDACPMALTEPAELLVGLAQLDTGRCLAYNGVLCMSCRSACSAEALRFDARFRPEVDTERCTGCGFCVGVCPE
ncbi:MAG TPA: 4Fe-4S dicluster domain-containing protein, partial [Chromatiales bacterium]|nr:4Fe-4S dicluster domain-containing protein [Chromatiales bacterium]